MSRTQLKRAGWTSAILIVLGGLSVGAYYASRDTAALEVVSTPVTRGSIVAVVSATGTLEALTTVLVGTQVSGTVLSLNADFNSVVRRGDLIATLDPSLLEAQAEQARANATKAAADLERSRVSAADAERQLARARELASRQLLPKTDLEAAEAAALTSAAQVKSSAAQLAQARASLSQAEVNIQKTRIYAPIDGTVISRNVDVGQTVAASMQAPTLFEIAADLTAMRVNAAIDESDVGRIADGQAVRFTVDAFPEEEFRGEVRQVRLQPVVNSNVVTYGVIIGTSNPHLKLRPGMTATVTIEVARRDQVLRVPSAALRFRPTEAVLAALGGETANATLETQVASVAGGGAGARGARVWVYVNDSLTSVPVTTGISDGVTTEVSGSGLDEGAEVVTQVRSGESGTAASSSAAGRNNPLLGSTQGPSGPPPGMGR